MFTKFSKWLDGMKARRDDAQAVLEHAADVARARDHGHSHEHFDGVVHEHAHGHGDHDHRHDHEVGGSRPES